MDAVEIGTERGTLTICADAAKLLFPQYVADPLGANDDAESAAEFIVRSVLKNVLALAPEPGREIVLIAVGSPASGKTAILDSPSEETVEFKIEETFDDLERARRLLLQLLEAGRRPVVLWLYVDNAGKTVERMFRRAVKIGRVDRLEDMVKAYSNVPRVIEAIQREFGEIVNVYVVDNSGLPGETRFVENMSPEGRRPGDYDLARAGWIQVYTTNKKFQENPEYEVPY